MSCVATNATLDDRVMEKLYKISQEIPDIMNIIDLRQCNINCKTSKMAKIIKNLL